jgi:hypothetical protein
MLVRSAICLVVAVAFIVATQSELHAKKGAAAPAPATTATKKTDNRKGAILDEDYDDEDEEVLIDPKTGKARAKEFEKGKPVDAAKTKGQVGKITGSVNDLAAALRKSGKATPPPPPPPAKAAKNAKTAPKVVEEDEVDEDEVTAPRRKKSRTPTTQPASQPAKTAKNDSSERD